MVACYNICTIEIESLPQEFLNLIFCFVFDCSLFHYFWIVDTIKHLVHYRFFSIFGTFPELFGPNISSFTLLLNKDILRPDFDSEVFLENYKLYSLLPRGSSLGSFP